MSTDLHIINSIVIDSNGVFAAGKRIEASFDPQDLQAGLKAIYKAKDWSYSKFYKMDPVSRLAFIAGEFLLENQSLDAIDPSKKAIVLSNQTASLDTDERFYQGAGTPEYRPSPADFVYTLPNIMSGELSIRHKLKGENAFFIFDQFNPVFLHWYVTDLMEKQGVELSITGWVEFYDNQMKAALYLVGKEPVGPEFTSETMRTIFNH